MRALNNACTAVDAVAYRPAAVKLTLPLPRWWSCQLARLSMRLDERWATGYWSSADGPAVPGGRCDACTRRPAWLVVGGRWDEDDPDHPFAYEHPALDARAVHLCGWCRLEPDAGEPIRDSADLERALARARARSIAWHWR